MGPLDWPCCWYSFHRGVAREGEAVSNLLCVFFETYHSKLRTLLCDLASSHSVTREALA